MLHERRVDRLILSRPALEAGERLGFLPGDLKEKIDPYLRPLYDALFDVLGDAAGRLMEQGVIEVAPLAFMRGRTLTRAFVHTGRGAEHHPGADEDGADPAGRGQSHGGHRRSFPKRSAGRAWRLASTRRWIFCKDVEGVGVARFGEKDVVRHPLVARIVAAYNRAWASNERDHAGG